MKRTENIVFLINDDLNSENAPCLEGANLGFCNFPLCVGIAMIGKFFPSYFVYSTDEHGNVSTKKRFRNYKEALTYAKFRYQGLIDTYRVIASHQSPPSRLIALDKAVVTQTVNGRVPTPSTVLKAFNELERSHANLMTELKGVEQHTKLRIHKLECNTDIQRMTCSALSRKRSTQHVSQTKVAPPPHEESPALAAQHHQ